MTGFEWASSESDIKVLHLSTSHTGGAGIAARRLNTELNSQGFNSLFLTLSSSEFVPSSSEIAITRGFRSQLLSKIYTTFARLTFGRTYFTLISSNTISLKRIKSLGKPENTIIHIHNWFNLINLRVLNEVLAAGYRVVFTLHDQRLFTGGCHYSIECSKYIESCNSCPGLFRPLKGVPRRNLKRSSRVFEKFSSQITCISPSGWLQRSASSSFLLRDIPVLQIGNIHSFNDDVSRIQRKHSDEKTILGVASMDRFSPLKGFQNVNTLEKYLSDNYFPFEIRYLADYAQQIERKQDFWLDIDYLLVLSNADNSPNVIHEAKIHGVPVIGSNVGGIPELLNSAYDFCVDIDLDMSARILDFLRGRLSLNNQELSQKIFSDYKLNSREILGQFISTYKHILED
jgi:hypothetical protein